MVLVMQTDAPFWDSLVFEGIDNVDLEAVTAAFGTVGWWPEAARPLAACPDCGRFSDRVHDRYQRRLTDPRRILGVVSGGRATGYVAWTLLILTIGPRRSLAASRRIWQ